MCGAEAGRVGRGIDFKHARRENKGRAVFGNAPLAGGALLAEDGEFFTAVWNHEINLPMPIAGVSFWGEKSFRCACVAGAAMLALAAGAFARPLPVRPDWPFLIDVWETDDGLPQNSVTSIAQTSDGFLWLGTFAGLVRFDGVEFDVFDKFNTAGLSSSSVTAMLADSRGRLWVGTDNGISLKQGNRWRSFGRTNGWPDAQVLSFAESEQHDILVSGNDSRLYRFTGAGFERFQSPPVRGTSALHLFHP